jgi:hypothetical protein
LAHKEHTTKWSSIQQQWHTWALLSLLTLALLGQPQESQAGWFTCPPCVPGLPPMHAKRQRARSMCPFGARLRSAWQYATRSWCQPCLRSLLLALLWSQSGQQGPVEIIGWPWLLWLWQMAGVAFPEFSRQPLWRVGCRLLWQGQWLLLAGYLGLALRWIAPGTKTDSFLDMRSANGFALGLGCQFCGQKEPWVEVVGQDDGGYEATLCGHFTVQVAGDDPFRGRLLMLFLRLLDVPGPQRGSRRTRDGRTPIVRQRQAAEWFGLPRPNVSRVEGYWQRAAWPELLSQCTPEILTAEVVQRVVTACATYPHWNRAEVYGYLQDQGVRISYRQLRQAMEQSGWSTLRQELRRRYHWTPKTFHLQEEWLVQELLRQVHLLHECLEKGQPLPAEEQVALADLQTLLQEVGIEPEPPPQAVPWMLRVKRVLFGEWQAVEEDTIRCPGCGTTHIVRKSRKPRLKKFYDAQGKLQEVPVYRYRCSCMSNQEACVALAIWPSAQGAGRAGRGQQPHTTLFFAAVGSRNKLWLGDLPFQDQGVPQPPVFPRATGSGLEMACGKRTGAQSPSALWRDGGRAIVRLPQRMAVRSAPNSRRSSCRRTYWAGVWPWGR